MARRTQADGRIPRPDRATGESPPNRAPPDTRDPDNLHRTVFKFARLAPMRSLRRRDGCVTEITASSRSPRHRDHRVSAKPAPGVFKTVKLPKGHRRVEAAKG